MGAVVEPGSRAARAVAYMAFVKGDAPRTARPDFTYACWDEMAELVDPARFVRIGGKGEETGWRETVDFMNQFIDMEHYFTVLRATETGDRVFLEMEEVIPRGDEKMVFNSAYIYTFDDADRIVRLEFFQQ